MENSSQSSCALFSSLVVCRRVLNISLTKNVLNQKRNSTCRLRIILALWKSSTLTSPASGMHCVSWMTSWPAAFRVRLTSGSSALYRHVSFVSAMNEMLKCTLDEWRLRCGAAVNRSSLSCAETNNT